MTAIAQAMQAAGYSPAAERLRRIAETVLQAHERDWTAARSEFVAKVQNDPELLWELFAPYRNQAIQSVLSAAAAKLRRDRTPREVPRQGGGGGHRAVDDQVTTAPAAPRSPSAGLAAVAAVTRQSLIDTFQLNGRPIGDATSREALSWAGARERDARFVRLLTANLPLDLPIRRFRSDPDEVAALYAQAEAAHV